MNEDKNANEPVETENNTSQTYEVNIIEEKTEKGVNWVREIIEWIVSIGLAIIIGLFLNHFVFTLVQVSGDSMTDTLHDGDRLFLVSKYLSQPDNGDIVVFYPVNDNKPYIKRVIATEGQTVEVIYDYETGEQRVYVDDELLEESYVRSYYTNYGDMDYPITIDEDCVFVMGDNRPNSHDSRQSDVGQVKINAIRGKVLFRWWPFTKFGGI
ncbi:MAG: signal peptidase I [Eubacteriales bacterium]|nr:signal peptidase I [Eubacteriales bacterium]